MILKIFCLYEIAFTEPLHSINSVDWNRILNWKFFSLYKFLLASKYSIFWKLHCHFYFHSLIWDYDDQCPLCCLQSLGLESLVWYFIISPWLFHSSCFKKSICWAVVGFFQFGELCPLVLGEFSFVISLLFSFF